MPMLIILIIISFSFYIFYKIKFFRSQKPIERKWLSTKSSIALGAFIGFFGINTLLVQQSTTSLIIGILFIAVGIGSVWIGFKAYKHYLPFVIEEAEQS